MLSIGTFSTVLVIANAWRISVFNPSHTHSFIHPLISQQTVPKHQPWARPCAGWWDSLPALQRGPTPKQSLQHKVTDVVTESYMGAWYMQDREYERNLEEAAEKESLDCP